MWEGGRLLQRLEASHASLQDRLTRLELEAGQQSVAANEATTEIARLKSSKIDLDHDLLAANKEADVLRTKTELRKRQIERAMFLVRKREEMFKHDVEGREVVQTILRALTEDEADLGVFSIREMTEEEMDKIIYKLSETRQGICRWIFLLTFTIFNRESRVGFPNKEFFGVDKKASIRETSQRVIHFESICTFGSESNEKQSRCFRSD